MRAILLLLLLCAALADADCLTYTDGGKRYDISKLSGKTYTATDDQFDYKIAVCENAVSSCTTDAAVCQEYDKWKVYLNFGTEGVLSVDHSGSLVLTYYNGQTCAGGTNWRSTITFSCDPSAGTGSPEYYDWSSADCVYEFRWATAEACGVGVGGGESKGLSTGSVIVIIFFVTAFLYLAIGMAYRFRFQEARGLDMIPNRGFWSTIPGLVWDGIVFTFTAIKSRISGDDGYGHVP